MEHLAAGRRRAILARGRTMTLRRAAGPGVPQVDVSLVGFPRLYQPGEIEGAIQQGDQRVEILNEEIVAAGFPAPGKGIWLVLDGRQVKVEGAMPVYEGAAVIGWSLWVRG